MPLARVPQSLPGPRSHTTASGRSFRWAVVLGCCLAWASTPGLSHATCATDTVVVYGSTRFYGGGGYPSFTLYDPEYFSTTTSWGRRYIIELKNGSPALSGVSLLIDGQEWIGTDELGSGVGSLTRTIEVADGSHSHSIEVSVQGAEDAYVDVRVLHVTEPMFKVYGRKIFIKPSPAAAQQDSFAIPIGAKSGYSMRILNGDSTGAHRTNNCQVKLNNVEVLAYYEFSTGTATFKRDVTLLGSGQQNHLEVNNSGASSSRIDVEFTATDSTAPYITLSGPAEGFATEASAVTVAGSITDETPVTVTIDNGTPIKTNSTFSQSFSMAADGNYTITVHAANSACFTADTLRHVARDNLAPALTVNRPGATFAPVDSEAIAISITWADTIMTYLTLDGDTVANARSGTYTNSGYKLDLGPNRIVFRARDALGHATTITRFVYRQPSESVIDSNSIAVNALVPTEIPPFLSRVRFLYGNGSPPLQTVSDTLVFDSTRAAVVRGRVTARDYGSLANVLVKVLGHDDYGSTLTRNDGQFDLVVNGGSTLILRFIKSGYLEAQRQVDVPVNDFAVVDSVALIGQSVKRFVVKTDSARVVVGRFENDANGDRRLTMLFTPGTICSLTTSSGALTMLTNFQVRLKEFTVGSSGDDAMPAALPPSTAYTYCVDMGVVEADSLGYLGSMGNPPPNVRFNQPVIAYVKEFLGIRVGRIMPTGYYNQRIGKWVAAEDGVVIKLLSKSSGLANLDTDGDGSADATARYDALGIGSTERAMLAERFAVDDSLWRMRVRHFSPQDDNLNLAALAYAASPSAANAAQWSSLTENPSITCGCVVENENRVLGETIPVLGTPFSLSYRSDRQPGDNAMRWLFIPITGSNPPDSLLSIRVTVDVVGRRYKHTIRSFNENDAYTFKAWDGKDPYGRTVQGSVVATVRLGYEFRQYMGATTNAGSGGAYANAARNPTAPGNQTNGDRSVGRILWITQRVSLGAPTMQSAGLGGWTISPHHFYDPNGRGTLYLGDGSLRLGSRQYPIIKTFAGNGSSSGAAGDVTDGTLAKEFALTPGEMAFGPDGSLYFTDQGRHEVGRISTDGKYYRIAGMQNGAAFAADGDSARGVALGHPQGIAVAPDGSVYFADQNLWRVFRVSPNGRLYSVAGTGSQSGSLFEDSLATRQRLVEPVGVALGPDGSLFVSDYGDKRVRRIGTDGLIRTYAGNGSQGASGLDGKADSLSLIGPTDMDVDAAGNLYILENATERIRRVSPDGRMTTYALLADGLWPQSIDLAPDGAVYVGFGGGYAPNGVARIEPDGTVSSICGPTPYEGAAGMSSEDGGYARAATFGTFSGIAMGGDGALYVGQLGTGGDANGIRRILGELPGELAGEVALPSADAREVYYFTPGGRHLHTDDAVTGATLFKFAYDAIGRLTSLVDVNSDTTKILRDGSGEPTEIVAPYGQRTLLTIEDGYLSKVRNPLNGEEYLLTADAGGLLGRFKNPRGYEHEYDYNTGSTGDGRLVEERDDAYGSHHLDLSESGIDRKVTDTSAEGRATAYTVIQQMDGLRRRIVRRPDGSVASLTDSMTLTAPFGRVLRAIDPDGVNEHAKVDHCEH